MKIFCNHCKKEFSSGESLHDHPCEPKRKWTLALTTLGQDAKRLWNEWLQLKRLSPQSTSCFIESSYFQNFIDFACFVKEKGIEEPERYLALMVANGVPPVAFERPECLKAYCEKVGKPDMSGLTAPEVYDKNGKPRKEFPRELDEWVANYGGTN